MREGDIKTDGCYLRQNVVAEPLFNQWYAWAGLINPATAAMHIANSHLKILRSFVSAPQFHVAALKNLQMLGGPFMNYDESRLDEARELLDRTSREQARMLALAEAIRQLDEMLAKEADGSSLEPLYAKVPDLLKGYVELVYDLNNQPAMRFIEGLLYESPYYNPGSQGLALHLTRGDGDRSFVFSTPRLRSDGCLHLDIPFADERLDELFSMKSVPRPYDRIKALLAVEDKDDELFSSFFTREAPAGGSQYEGDGVRIRYLGHACLLIESAGASIITDPVVSYKPDTGIPRYSYADLPESLDYALITHGHQDHCMFESLLQLRHKIKSVVVPRNNPGALSDPSLKTALRRIGFENVMEVDEMETLKFEGGVITGLPFLGEHGDLNIRTKTAYLVGLEGRTILLAADSNNIEPRLYEHVHGLTGDIDVLFIGMECDGAPLSWIYGSLLTRSLPRKQDQSRRLNGSDYEKAIRIVNCLRPGQVYVYAMGQEPWLTYVTSIRYTEESRPIIESNKLVADCRSRGLASERLFGQKEIYL